MLSLPPGVQVDVSKCLNFEQLFSLKQTNFYFRNLIEKYEGGLARMKFFELLLWKAAIAKSIPLFLHGNGNDSEDFSVQVKREDKKPRYILKLPNIPKTIEEMIVIRFWLEQLFNCAFELCYLVHTIFNPEMINLLFDDDKTILKQFHVQKATIYPSNEPFEIFLKFSLSRVAIYKSFSIALEDISERNTDILFNIIINEGKKLPSVAFGICNSARLYDRIVEHITTSEDCSKIVSNIILVCRSFENFDLPERAENVKTEQRDNLKSTVYEIGNIYFSKNERRIDRVTICYVHITKMKSRIGEDFMNFVT
ncbi:unnamed protein product [Meloidogyne enterolobii]|uniref:Uncharacterized protein n=1 Tax=Meloidogyne enterolobii TaxID=390850 RepID=A0ACB1AMU6_MELEN